MKRITLLIACAALALTGCASNDYALYAKGQAESDTARHNADAAKYKAMADIAATGTDSAKVAAVMALALGAQGQAGQAGQGMRLQAPQASSALQWAQVLVPGLTQMAGIAANMQVATTQSNNAARVAESTNASFVGIASQIQAAPTITTTTTTSTDRHDVVTPAPVVVTPVTVIEPTVIQPLVQVVPILASAAP